MAVFILDLLYPKRCPVCDEALPLGTKICPICEETLVKIQGPVCCKCGKHIEDDSEELCHDCEGNTHVFDSGLALYEYDVIHKSIYRMKYSGRSEYAQYFGEKLGAELGDRVKKWNADMVISVPLHCTKLRTRGYNQAEIMAEKFADVIGVPYIKNCVLRTRKTTPLKELSPAQRQINLKNAFNIGEFDVELKCIIIVDDIYTTGSTIDAIAKVLKENGAISVHYVALAIGRGV